MGNMKEISSKNRTYRFFDDIINITNFDSNLLKIDKKSYKNTDIYYIGYIIMKDSDYARINNVNLLYLIIDKVDEHLEEKNGNKCLILDSTDKNKEVLIKYTKLWDGIKNFIESNSIKCNFVEKVNNKFGEYGKDFMKIKFNSDDNLPLNKTLKLHNKTIIIRSVFQGDGKYYPQVFSDGCLYEL